MPGYDCTSFSLCLAMPERTSGEPVQYNLFANSCLCGRLNASLCPALGRRAEGSGMRACAELSFSTLTAVHSRLLFHCQQEEDDRKYGSTVPQKEGPPFGCYIYTKFTKSLCFETSTKKYPQQRPQNKNIIFQRYHLKLSLSFVVSCWNRTSS